MGVCIYWVSICQMKLQCCPNQCNLFFSFFLSVKKLNKLNVKCIKIKETNVIWLKTLKKKKKISKTWETKLSLVALFQWSLYELFQTSSSVEERLQKPRERLRRPTGQTKSTHQEPAALGLSQWSPIWLVAHSMENISFSKCCWISSYRSASVWPTGNQGEFW